MPAKIPAFISYAHADAASLEELLGCLSDDTHLELWYDKKIRPGTNWDAEILKYLDTADIVMLLVSKNSLSSTYIQEKEIKRTLERDNCRKVGVFIGPIADANYPLSDFQALPAGPNQPVSLYEDKTAAWAQVRLGIEKVIADTRASYLQVAEERIGKLQKATDTARSAIILLTIMGGLYILVKDRTTQSVFSAVMGVVLITGALLAFFVSKRIKAH